MPVIELDSRRSPVTSAMLSGLGFERPAEWKLISHVSKTFLHRGVVGAPSVVAINRGRATMRAVQIASGESTNTLPTIDIIAARFHAYIAAGSLVNAGRRIVKVEVSAVFSDGNLVDLDPIDMRLGDSAFDKVIEDVEAKPHLQEISLDKLVPRLARESGSQTSPSSTRQVARLS